MNIDKKSTISLTFIIEMKSFCFKQQQKTTHINLNCLIWNGMRWNEKWCEYKKTEHYFDRMNMMRKKESFFISSYFFIIFWESV